MSEYSSSSRGGDQFGDSCIGLGIPDRFGFGQINRRRLRLDQHFQLVPLRRIGIRFLTAPTIEGGFQFSQTTIQTGRGHWRSQMANQRRVGPPLGEHPF